MSLVGLANLSNHFTGYNANGTPVIMNKNKNKTFFKYKKKDFFNFQKMQSDGKLIHVSLNC